jgi:hypothetical protein
MHSWASKAWPSSIGKRVEIVHHRRFRSATSKHLLPRETILHRHASDDPPDRKVLKQHGLFQKLNYQTHDEVVPVPLRPQKRVWACSSTRSKKVGIAKKDQRERD